jgi:hypothetical protein
MHNELYDAELCSCSDNKSLYSIFIGQSREDRGLFSIMLLPRISVFISRRTACSSEF